MKRTDMLLVAEPAVASAADPWDTSKQWPSIQKDAQSSLKMSCGSWPVPQAPKALTARAFRAAYGNISNTTFYELVKRGELAIHKIGRRTYVDAAEADRWWLSCAQGPR